MSTLPATNVGHHPGYPGKPQDLQRMQSYAIYCIAETIRVLLFMTLSILVFNFYPVTAVMIVLLALLNDGVILSFGAL